MLQKAVAVIGGGPAGAFAAYLLAREGVHVDIYEPRAVEQPLVGTGERRSLCTGCAGLVQGDAARLLKRHGIIIPDEVIQTRLLGAAVYLGSESEPILVPLENAITVYRGFGPLRQEGGSVESFDAYLLNRAKQAGASHHRVTIAAVDLREQAGRVTLLDCDGRQRQAHLVIGAFGHNAKLAEAITYPDSRAATLTRPVTQNAGIREYHLGGDVVGERLNSRIHIFGNPSDSVWFAAILPKGKYISVALMGRDGDIRARDFDTFLSRPQVQALLGDAVSGQAINCGCSSTITLRSPERFMVGGENGRVVMVNIGDAGPTRPRKNGIFAALDSAERLSSALLRHGNTTSGLEEYRRYITRRYVWDNRWADTVLRLSDLVLDRSLSRWLIMGLAQGHVPILSRATTSTIIHIVSGKDSYWRIPLNVLRETLVGQKAVI